MITRRKVLWGGVGVVGLAGLGTLAFGRLGLEAQIVSVLRRRLAYLKLSEQGLHAFAKDQTDAVLHKKIPTWNRLRYHFLPAAVPSFNRYNRSTDSRSRVVRLEDTLVSTFLLSSDFFINGADESQVVNYMAYFDPLLPCRNPFSRPVVVS
jgi:hypothetical protein